MAIVTFRGSNHATQAAAALPRVRAYQGLEGAYAFPVEFDRNGLAIASAIGVGQFVDGEDPRGLDEAERVRALAGAGGTKPFAKAALVARPQRPIGDPRSPVTSSPEAARGPEPANNSATAANAGAAKGPTLPGKVKLFDLSRVRAQYGKAAIVTLQVGVYERIDGAPLAAGDLAEIRASAEAAVAKLRSEGEPAYFLHGPRRSMVTIGILAEGDVIPKPTPEAVAMRKKHPYNLLNGQGYKAGPKGEVKGSEFVRVP